MRRKIFFRSTTAVFSNKNEFFKNGQKGFVQKQFRERHYKILPTTFHPGSCPFCSQLQFNSRGPPEESVGPPPPPGPLGGGEFIQPSFCSSQHFFQPSGPPDVLENSPAPHPSPPWVLHTKKNICPRQCGAARGTQRCRPASKHHPQLRAGAVRQHAGVHELPRGLPAHAVANTVCCLVLVLAVGVWCCGCSG